jgi:hypothetical protein
MTPLTRSTLCCLVRLIAGRAGRISLLVDIARERFFYAMACVPSVSTVKGSRTTLDS